MSRANLKCDETTRDRLAAYKRDGETWDDLLQAAAGLLAVARTDTAIADETEYAERRGYDTVPARLLSDQLVDDQDACPSCASQYVYVQEVPVDEIGDYDIGCAGCGRARDSEPLEETAEEILGADNE